MKLSDCRVGQRVQMSEAGRKVWHTKNRTGAILRVRKTMIVIRRDAIRNPDNWLPVYWELEGVEGDEGKS